MNLRPSAKIQEMREIRFIKRTKKTVALRLDPEDIKSVSKKSLSGRDISYTSLLRMWIKDHLAKEAKRVA